MAGMMEFQSGIKMVVRKGVKMVELLVFLKADLMVAL